MLRWRAWWLWREPGLLGIQAKRSAHTDANVLSFGQRCLKDEANVSMSLTCKIELKSLILAQIERWRHALHMQVERQRGATWRRAANG